MSVPTSRPKPHIVSHNELMKIQILSQYFLPKLQIPAVVCLYLYSSMGFEETGLGCHWMKSSKVFLCNELHSPGRQERAHWSLSVSQGRKN